MARRKQDHTLWIGAAVVAYLLYTRHKNGAQPATGDSAGTGSQFYSPAPPPILKPPVAVNATPAPPPAPVVTPTPTPAPPPVVAPIDVELNAHGLATAASAQWQKDAFVSEADRLRSMVASGEVQPGSADYQARLDYIANLRGGVAQKEAGFAELEAAGLTRH